MDVQLLRQFKKGEQMDSGLIFPGVDDTEVRWTCTNVVNGTRVIDGKEVEFRMAEFALEYCGVPLADVRAFENDDGEISWEAVK